MSTKRVIVGMSGGVDSSVAAYLLKKQGYDVTGTLCYYWNDPKDDGVEVYQNKCCSVESQSLARRVCQKLGIPFYTMDLSREFKKRIVDSFVEGYEKGETPNPCVTCNKYIKFGLFYEKAKQLGFDYVATGHYSKIIDEGGEKALLKATDELKDQSYFLYNFNQEILSSVLFPLADLTKEEVRKIAAEQEFPSATTRDSQGICFIKNGKHNDFLERYLEGAQKGDIINEEGEVIGEHRGLPYYTLGQRSGIGVGGGRPYYVCERDFETNTLHVTTKPNDERLLTSEITLRDVNWLSDSDPVFPFESGAKIRYMKNTLPVTVQGYDSEGNVTATFAEPVKFVMAGQSAVFFDGEKVLGGGIIAS